MEPVLFADLLNKDLIAYGTGVVGDMIISYLKALPRCRLIGITNSKATESDCGTFLETGLSVRSIEEWKRQNPEASIVITTTEKHHREIIDVCKKAGFHDIIPASLELVSAATNWNGRQLKPEEYEEKLKQWYRLSTKRELDLGNPKTYNEKIQWLKLYDSTPVKTRLADKYLVREWVAEKIGEEYLIPLLGVWDNFDEIDFEALPNNFVLKTNHGSGWNVIVPDKCAFDKESARRKINAWMQSNFAYWGGLELHYLNIPPKIIAEQYIEGIDHFSDYKFMCFDGKVKFIWVDVDRFADHRRTLYDRSWIRRSESIRYSVSECDVPKPENLEKMIAYAEVLSSGFAHARIDFYEVNGKMYFGEITFTSGSGVETVTPESFNFEMGSWITLPSPNPIPTRP